MGFWSDLKNANPHKSLARGRELFSARISAIERLNSISASELKDTEIGKCEVCHVTFGAAFSGNSYPCIIQVSMFDHLSFGEHLPNVVACNKCVETFHLTEALQRTNIEIAQAKTK